MIKLTELRKERKLSMSALARKANLHVSTISLIENHRLRPYPGQVKKLINALDWKDDPMELFDEVEPR